MSIQDITNAAAAMNALKVRYEGFLDDADDQIGARQAAYDGLAGDLVGIVSDRMRVTIAFDPNAAAANLAHNGVFRDWPEFLAFIQPLPSDAYVTVRMSAGDVLVVTNAYNSSTYGPIHFDFRAFTNEAVGARPILRSLCWDQVNFNRWTNIVTGTGGSFFTQYVDMDFEAAANTALPNTVQTTFFQNKGFPIRLNNTRVKGVAGQLFARVVSGDIGYFEFSSAEFDGIIGVEQYGGAGVAIISEKVTTLSNGGTLHSPSFTLGTDLLKG